MSKLVKSLLARLDRALFQYQVRAGLILCAVPESDPPPAEEGESDPPPAEEDPGEVVVSIGEEAPPPEDEEQAKAPEWVRELRKSQRELARENRELKAKLEGKAAEAEPAADLGKKPKLEDYDYDTEKFEQELAAWHDRKRAADDAAAAARAKENEAAAAWQATLDAYGRAKGELKIAGAEDAEAQAMEALSVTQQGLILQGAENSALVIVALGKNPTALKEIAAIKDPVKFAFAVAKLEAKLKVTPRKAAPPPETVPNGSAPKSGSVDSNLERLRAEAAKTGDYTKVTQYKRSLRKTA